MEVSVSGAGTEADAATVANVEQPRRSPDWEFRARPELGPHRDAADAGVPFDPNQLDITLGDFQLMRAGQSSDRAAAERGL